MTLKVRKGKVNRHEKITQVLLSGKPVSPDEIKAVFSGTDQESVLYRLSTNIYNIRLDGGIRSDRTNPIYIEEGDLVYHNESYFSIVTETVFYKKEEKKYGLSLFHGYM